MIGISNGVLTVARTRYDLRAQGTWLRSPGFDLAWLVGLPALGAVLLLSIVPGLGALVWIPYVLLSGQPHLMSTYSRLFLEPAQWRRWWRPTVLLPGIILAAVLAVMAWGGELVLAALYTFVFSWGFWHYARQSYGVARQYQRRLGADDWDRRLLTLAVHVPAVAAIIWFMTSLRGDLLGLPVLTIPLPAECGAVLLGVAALAVLPSLVRAASSKGAGGAGRLDLLVAGVSGTVFYTALVFTPDARAAYLGVSMWHSLQYQAFVFHAQGRTLRQSSGTAGASRILACLLAAPHRYFLVLVVAAFCVFAALPFGTELFGVSEAMAVRIAAVVWLVVNIHHYLLDSWIWAGPKPSAVPATAPVALAGR
jgi:hypothetical protein